MIIDLKYRYYSRRAFKGKKVKLYIKDLVEGTYEFDTERYYDTLHNYYNAVEGYLRGKGVTEIYLLTIIKAE